MRRDVSSNRKGRERSHQEAAISATLNDALARFIISNGRLPPEQPSLPQAISRDKRLTLAFAEALAPLSKRMSHVEDRMNFASDRMRRDPFDKASDLLEIESDIAQLRRQLHHLAQRDHVSALESRVRHLAEDLRNTQSCEDVARLTGLAGTFQNQVEKMSPADQSAAWNRLSHAIAALSRKLDVVAGTLDRMTANRLEIPLAELRESLEQLADPLQMERLSEMTHALGREIAEMRLQFVGADDFKALKGALEDIHAAIRRDASIQEPVQVDARFDRLEDAVQQVGKVADTSNLELLLQGINERFDRQSLLDVGALEGKIERLWSGARREIAESLDASFSQIKTLRMEATSIADHAAKTALKEALTADWGLGTLSRSLSELKELQENSDHKTGAALQALHHAVEMLARRLPGEAHPKSQAEELEKPNGNGSSVDTTAAVRLENAVQKLQQTVAPVPERMDSLPQTPSLTASQAEKPGAIRANFIAAARRATNARAASSAYGETHPNQNLMDRLRQTFESSRKPGLSSLGFMVILAGCAGLMGGGFQAGHSLPMNFDGSAFANAL